jgi:hypothetical protein
MSYHDFVEEMIKKIREDGMTNVFDLMPSRKKFAANSVSKPELPALLTRTVQVECR